MSLLGGATPVTIQPNHDSSRSPSPSSLGVLRLGLLPELEFLELGPPLELLLLD